ncbi:MAG: hypothetical protein AAF628_06650 [Planctomycetota bacterium]
MTRLLPPLAVAVVALLGAGCDCCPEPLAPGQTPAGTALVKTEIIYRVHPRSLPAYREKGEEEQRGWWLQVLEAGRERLTAPARAELGYSTIDLAPDGRPDPDQLREKVEQVVPSFEDLSPVLVTPRYDDHGAWSCGQTWELQAHLVELEGVLVQSELVVDVDFPGSPMGGLGVTDPPR